MTRVFSQSFLHTLVLGFAFHSCVVALHAQESAPSRTSKGGQPAVDGADSAQKQRIERAAIDYVERRKREEAEAVANQEHAQQRALAEEARAEAIEPRRREKGGVYAQPAEPPTKPDAALTETSKQMLVLTLWVVSLSDSDGQAEGRGKSALKPTIDGETASLMKEYATSLVKQHDKNGNMMLDADEQKELRGRAADADLNHDGTVTVDELVTHLSPKSHVDDGDDTKRGASSATNLDRRLSSLPAGFGSIDRVRSFIKELEATGHVRASRELRILTLDGQTVRVQVGADKPQVTSVSVTNMGRSNTLRFLPVGTIVEVRTHIDSDKRIQAQLDYNSSELERAKDVPMFETTDGKTKVVPDITVTHQLKTSTKVKNGGAVVLQCDASSGSAADKSAGRTEILILGGELVPAQE